MYEAILSMIESQNWKEAIEEIEKEISIHEMDEKLAVLSGIVFHKMGDETRAREEIARGLALNYKNYELWLMLGETYQNVNINQAYLCYENALFYCTEDEDKVVIGQYLENAKQGDDFCVRKSAIVILSYNSVNYTRGCIESIRETCPESAYEIVVVDNNSKDESVKYLKGLTDIKLQINTSNVGFPAGCNQGIRMAEGESDIFLLNNDTIMPPNALFWLRMGLYETEKVGATGSVSNYVSNAQAVQWGCKSIREFLENAVTNNLPMKYPYEYKNYLVGFAVLIKRSVLEEIGYLDELFTPGTYEDNDLGLRLCKAGYDVLLCKNSFIFHYGSGGGSNVNKWNNLCEKNAAKLSDKWGFSANREFYYNRRIVELINAPRDAKLRILEVGCGLGGTLLALKSRFPNAEVYGIENNKNLSAVIPYCIGVWETGPETGELECPENFFDIIIISDVFDRSFDQPALLYKYSIYLNNNGLILAGNRGIGKLQSTMAYIGSINDVAVCVYTHNHPASVESVLERMCLDYYLHKMDVYYFDSSENEDTEKVVRKWINKGYSNIKYIDCKGMTMNQKMIASIEGQYFDKKYKYIWPTKDRSIWLPQTLDLVNESKEKGENFIYLEPVADDDNEVKVYSDSIGENKGRFTLNVTLFKYQFIYNNSDIYMSLVDTDQ